MILSERDIFCDNIALNTGAAGTYLIGDVMAGIPPGLARGTHPLYLYGLMGDAALDSANDTATVAFVLASDASAAIAVNGTATEHFRSKTFAVGAGTAAGKLLFVTALPEYPAYEPYLGILQITGTQAVTAGKVKIGISLRPPLGGWDAFAAEVGDVA